MCFAKWCIDRAKANLHYIIQMQTSPEQVRGNPIIECCLESIMSHESEEPEKEKVASIISKFGATNGYKQLSALTLSQYNLFKMLVNTFNAYKKSFHQAIEGEKYRCLDQPHFQVCTFLADIQKDIKVNKLSPTYGEMVSQYTTQLIKQRRKYGWTSQFLMYWTALVKARLQNLQKARSQTKAQSDSRKGSLRQVLTKPTLLKSKTKTIIPDKGHKQQTNGQRPMKKVKQAKSFIQKLEAMQKYIQGRPDLSYDKRKHRNVIQVIALGLDQFMKITIQKIIDISALKNKGKKDEISYFATQNQRITKQSPFNVPNSNIFTLSYKNKLEIYKLLRQKQLKKQDDLREALQYKLSQQKQKSNNRALRYLVSPRPSHSETIDISQQQKSNGIPQDSLQIKDEHAICYLEGHRYLRNSQLLFNSYHY